MLPKECTNITHLDLALICTVTGICIGSPCDT